MATPKNPNVFFVGIHDTKDLKKAIIESTRDTVVFMQKYETILKIRKEKNESIDNLKRLVKEINKMVSSLKTKLPESEIHRKLGSEEIQIEREILETGLEKKKVQSEISSRKKTIAKPLNESEKTAEVSEMEKLEQQLKELENRLKDY